MITNYKTELLLIIMRKNKLKRKNKNRFKHTQLNSINHLLRFNKDLQIRELNMRLIMMNKKKRPKKLGRRLNWREVS
jgi:hypothetical protein